LALSCALCGVVGVGVSESFISTNTTLKADTEDYVLSGTNASVWAASGSNIVTSLRSTSILASSGATHVDNFLEYATADANGAFVANSSAITGLKSLTIAASSSSDAKTLKVYGSVDDLSGGDLSQATLLKDWDIKANPTLNLDLTSTVVNYVYIKSVDATPFAIANFGARYTCAEKTASVSTETELLVAFESSTKITLTSDISLTNSVATLASVARKHIVTIDLNQHSIQGELIIGGNGDGEQAYGFMLGLENGTVGSLTDTLCPFGLVIKGNAETMIQLTDVTSVGHNGGLTYGAEYSGAQLRATGCNFSSPTGAKTDATLEGTNYIAGNLAGDFTNCGFSGDTAVYVKSGNLSFDGCGFEAFGTKRDAAYSATGFSSTGSAVVLDSHYGAKGMTEQDYITLKNSSFISANSYSVHEFATGAEGETKTPFMNVTMSDNNFMSALDDVKSENKKIKVTNSMTVSTYTELVDSVNAGFPYIKLAADITSTTEARFKCADRDLDFTIELNGYHIGCSVYFEQLDTSHSLKATIKGTGVDNEWIGGNGTYPDHNQFAYGVNLKGDSSLEVNLLDIKKIDGYWGGLNINGLSDGFNLSVKDCAFYCASGTKATRDDYGAGAYLGGYGTSDFENCTFKGETGVYVKGGVATFNQCTIIANGSLEDPYYFGNGFMSEGSGVALDSCVNYPGSSKSNSIIFYGGSITSTYGYAVREFQTGTGSSLYLKGILSATTKLTGLDANHKVKKDVSSLLVDTQTPVSTAAEFTTALADSTVAAIELTANMTDIDVEFTLNRSVAIFGNGKTITSALTNATGHSDNAVFRYQNNSSATTAIFDIKAKDGAPGDASLGNVRTIDILNNTNSKFILDSSTIEAVHYAVDLRSGNSNLGLYFNHSIFNGYCTFMTATYLAGTKTGEITDTTEVNVVFNNCIMESVNTQEHPENSNDFSTLAVNGGSNCTYNVNCCNMTAVATKDCTQMYVCFDWVAETSTINLSNVTYGNETLGYLTAADRAAWDTWLCSQSNYSTNDIIIDGVSYDVYVPYVTPTPAP
jgi:hypothetical protein